MGRGKSFLVEKRGGQKCHLWVAVGESVKRKFLVLREKKGKGRRIVLLKGPQVEVAGESRRAVRKTIQNCNC